MSLLDTVADAANKVFAALSRIVSIDLTDKRGFEADELTIELDDYDGAVAIPNTGSKITLHLGYQETGIVDKGEYLFSEFTHTGAPTA